MAAFSGRNWNGASALCAENTSTDIGHLLRSLLAERIRLEGRIIFLALCAISFVIGAIGVTLQCLSPIDKPRSTIYMTGMIRGEENNDLTYILRLTDSQRR